MDGNGNNLIRNILLFIVAMTRAMCLLFCASWMIDIDSVFREMEDKEKAIFKVSDSEREITIDLGDLEYMRLKLVSFIASFGWIYLIFGGIFFTSAIDYLMAILKLPNRAGRLNSIRDHIYIFMETI